MRSNRLLTATIVTLTLAACGGDGGGVGPGGAPSANFTQVCTDLACTFTDASTDPDGNTTITTRAWDFGDPNSGQANASAEVSPAHTFSAAGDYNVKLTVTDNGGNTNSKTVKVTVAAPTGGSPAAEFAITCSGLDCSFTDQSTDTDGQVVGWSWDFGDGSAASTETNPTHHYNVTTPTPFNVKLTVTDNAGLTGSITKATPAVSPPAGLQCNDGGTFVDCGLTLTQKSSVKITLTSADCTAFGTKVIITEPILDTIFTNACKKPVPGTAEATVTLQNGTAFAAGTVLKAQLISGSTKQKTAPAVHVLNDFPEWTLDFDDGEDVGNGEPDFNDIVVTVTATPQP